MKTASIFSFVLFFLNGLVSAQETAHAKFIECDFQVRKGLPKYKFRLIEDKKKGGAKIAIYCKDGTEVSSLSEPPEDEKVSIGEGENFLLYDEKFYQRPNCGFNDINFDGYLDIKALGNCGSACMLYFWLYEPTSKSFNYSFGSNDSPEPLPKEKIVYSVGQSGGTYYISKAKWVKGNLYFFYDEELKTILKASPNNPRETIIFEDHYMRYLKVRKGDKWIEFTPKEVHIPVDKLPVSHGW